MLEYASTISENPFKVGFVDEYSPKGWESVINYKLSEYKEFAYVDSTVELDKIMVVLELNPIDKELNLEYIKNEKELFKEYYKRILEEIENSEFYDLFLK
ncbi:MAG TPA: hypothetical protein VK426_03210 [Methanobacterium sp.]|nr:hypothetical protein [Methanobacterium sp.]